MAGFDPNQEKALFDQLSSELEDPYLTQVRDMITDAEWQLNDPTHPMKDDDIVALERRLDKKWLYLRHLLKVSGTVHLTRDRIHWEQVQLEGRHAISNGFIIKREPEAIDDGVDNQLRIYLAFIVRDPTSLGTIEYFEAPFESLHIEDPFPSDMHRVQRFADFQPERAQVIEEICAHARQDGDAFVGLKDFTIVADTTDSVGVDAVRDGEAYFLTMLAPDSELPYSVHLDGEVGVFVDDNGTVEPYTTNGLQIRDIHIVKVRIFPEDILQVNGGKSQVFRPFIEGTMYGRTKNEPALRVVVPFTSLVWLASKRSGI